jgi:hypothetical protein
MSTPSHAAVINKLQAEASRLDYVGKVNIYFIS